MACLSNLPFEITEQILKCKVLSCHDICRFSTVSQTFNAICQSNSLWQIKYEQRWPDLALLYSPFMNWKNEYKYRYQCKVLVSEELQKLSEDCYHQDNISNDSFFPIKGVCGVHPFSDNILVDELNCIMHGSDKHLNLTQKYYAKKALRFIRHNQLETIWRTFLVQPLNSISLLDGACLVSQWCQPTLIHCAKNVPNLLNALVLTVHDKVKQVSPKHPLIKHGPKSPSTHLESSKWSTSECRTVLFCMNIVLFQDLKFSGNCHNHYIVENTYIEKVLTNRTGVPLILAIIYCSVASSLGVLCEITQFPGKYYIRWKEHPELTANDAYSYIDVSENGSFKNFNDFRDYPNQPVNPNWFKASSPSWVFIMICKNLIDIGRNIEGNSCHPYDIVSLCNALELLSIIDPNDFEHKILLARVYLHLCINLREVISLLQEITAHDPASNGIVGYMYQSALSTLETQKSRRLNRKEKLQCRDNEEVKYAIGMIMKHKKYQYRCVIYGWDSVCTAGKDWISQMGVYNLPKKDKQPFYNVLVYDGTNRYAAQENLEIDDPHFPVYHPEIGRYFDSYHGNYYLANKEKMKEYPEDFQALQEILNVTNVVE